MPLHKPDNLQPGAEYHLSVHFCLAQAAPWAEQGHEVAWEQFALKWACPRRPVLAIAEMPALRCIEDHNQVIIEGSGAKENFRVAFDRAAGSLIAYLANGQNLILSGPLENYFRAPTDEDLLMGNPPAPIHKWRAAGLDCLERSVTAFDVTPIGSREILVRVSARLCAPGLLDGITSRVVYRVFGSGEIALENTVVIDERLPFVPRIGLELTLPRVYDRFTWFGRGPHENYVDRKCGAAVGLYHSTVSEQYTPYVYPSECGGKEDVRWLTLTDF